MLPASSSWVCIQCWVIWPDHIEQFRIFRSNFGVAGLEMLQSDPTLRCDTRHHHSVCSTGCLSNHVPSTPCDMTVAYTSMGSYCRSQRSDATLAHCLTTTTSQGPVAPQPLHSIRNASQTSHSRCPLGANILALFQWVNGTSCLGAAGCATVQIQPHALPAGTWRAASFASSVGSSCISIPVWSCLADCTETTSCRHLQPRHVHRYIPPSTEARAGSARNELRDL